MYYVLVKEFGEYDYFKYEPIEVYKTLEDAENSKQLHITEDSYIHKISTLRRKPYDKPNFVIFKVNECNNLNFTDDLNNLTNKYENEIFTSDNRCDNRTDCRNNGAKCAELCTDQWFN